MIEISFGKLVLLALVALIVLGPEKLPGAARTAGALLRRVRGGWESVRAEVERELQVEEIRHAAREAAAQAEKAQAELDASVREVRGMADSIKETAQTSVAQVTQADGAGPAMLGSGARHDDPQAPADQSDAHLPGAHLPPAIAPDATSGPAAVPYRAVASEDPGEPDREPLREPVREPLGESPHGRV